MAIREKLFDDYFKLFVKREGKVVLGKNYSSLWLLCAVLVATFLAISFSNASLKYLSYKMNDPFINWVDIKNPLGDADFSGFVERLGSDENLKAQFHFKGYQTDKYWYTTFFTAHSDAYNLRCRYFEDIRTPLVDAIMSDENVVDGHCIPSELRDNESFGVIITIDALKNKLGYDHIPAYIDYWAYCDAEAAEDFGVDVVQENYARIPVPVLAVVKRLPTNMDIIGTKHFYLQNLVYTLNLYNKAYASSLIYFIPATIDVSDAASYLQKLADEKGLAEYQLSDDLLYPRETGWRKGSFLAMMHIDEDDADVWANAEINKSMLEKFGSKGLVRIYDYEYNNPMPDTDDYVSIHFEDLNAIREFQEFAKSEYMIDIEMTQINAKENFNQVRLMANILSWTMIVFAIVCIILFIVNLLQSYFQKVKRNLGTFKAFGISNSSLIGIYVIILAAIIVTAVVLALMVTGIIQMLLPVFGIMKDGLFNYIEIRSLKTFFSVLVIVFASVYTVYIVMKSLLKATPGDLIYDR